MGVLLDPVDPDALQRAVAGVLQLTPAELRVLRQVVAGKSNAQIASDLALSRRTAEIHVFRILKACGCSRPVLIALGHDLERTPAVVDYVARMPAFDPHPAPGTIRRARARILE
jgi:DNA-binding CsgD family transcriptional regulator